MQTNDVLCDRTRYDSISYGPTLMLVCSVLYLLLYLFLNKYLGEKNRNATYCVHRLSHALPAPTDQ